MIRRPPIYTLPDTHVPYTTLFRSFHLLLQAGDQIYPDEGASLHKRARHNPLAAWSYRVEGDIGPLREAMQRELFRRYLELYRQPKVAWKIGRASCRERVCQYV